MTCRIFDGHKKGKEIQSILRFKNSLSWKLWRGSVRFRRLQHQNWNLQLRIENTIKLRIWIATLNIYILYNQVRLQSLDSLIMESVTMEILSERPFFTFINDPARTWNTWILFFFPPWVFWYPSLEAWQHFIVWRAIIIPSICRDRDNYLPTIRFTRIAFGKDNR